MTGQHHSHRYALPLDVGADAILDWKGGGLAMSGDSEIAETGTSKRYKLYAPRKPTFGEAQREVTEKVARLTLTYSDIFGRKHAAIYDLTAQYEWESGAYLRNIKQDLSDMEQEALREVPVYRAPDAPTALPQ